MKTTKEDRINAAIKIQENLEEINKNDQSIEWNPDKGFQCEWDDGKKKKIIFVPAKDFSGIAVYFYTENLATARIGLTIPAAINLSSGIKKMLTSDERFIENIKGDESK